MTFELDDLIPHRPPVRLVERVLGADERGARAELLVREGSSFLVGGVLAPEALVEALAQTCAVYAGVRGAREGEGGARAGVLASFGKFEFPAPARVGDRVELAVRLETILGPLAAFEGVATVGERVVARGELRVAVVEPAGQ